MKEQNNDINSASQSIVTMVSWDKDIDAKIIRTALCSSLQSLRNTDLKAKIHSINTRRVRVHSVNSAQYYNYSIFLCAICCCIPFGYSNASKQKCTTHEHFMLFTQILLSHFDHLRYPPLPHKESRSSIIACATCLRKIAFLKLCLITYNLTRNSIIIFPCDYLLQAHTQSVMIR